MILPFKPRTSLRFIVSSSSIPSIQTLKWVASSSLTNSQFLQQRECPFHHLRSLLDPQVERKRANHELALVAALKSCSTHLAISQGRQIHCFILKSGFDSNIFIQNSVINIYAKGGHLSDAKTVFDSSPGLDSASYNIMMTGWVKFGEIDDAHKLFEIMPEKDCVSYTTMIMGFAQNGRFSEAIDVFKQMRSSSLVPTDLTMATVISACSRRGGIWDCRMLHGLVIKMILNEFVLVSTNLLHMYCECSYLSEARALFNEMPARNIFSWNVMLNGYSKAGFVDLARDVFERIPEKDVVTWCTVIYGYVQAERFGEAFVRYRSMVSTGLSPNEILMVELVSACGKAMAIGEGQQMHCVVVKRGFDCFDFMQATVIHFYAASGRIGEACLQFKLGTKVNITSWNTLIVGFIRNGMIDRARQLFDEMPKRDVISWSTMISAYTQCELPSMALELFHGMVTSEIQPNEVTMVSVFSAIAALGMLTEGTLAHEYVCKNFVSLSDNLSAAIIDMYAKCGSINTALEVFDQIRNKAYTVSPWNAIICGLATHGHADLSLKIYSDLQRSRIKLNAITFIGVLSACCHVGLVDLGERYFKDMKQVHNIEPGIKHYGCMVDLLGRAGRLEEAEEVIRNMPMKADIVIWGTLLAASRTHGNIYVGKRAAEQLARLEPSHGASRVLLSNLYADAGRWEDAYLVRREMQNRRVQRLPGYSGIT